MDRQKLAIVVALIALASIDLRAQGAGQGTSPPIEARLQKLVGTWLASANSFGSDARLTGASAAGGRAVYTSFTQTSGGQRYEANSLWAFDPQTSEVRVFETNSAGLVALHTGRFESRDVLVIERRDGASNAVVQRSSLAWSGDTLNFKATFFANGRASSDSIIFVRR